MKHWFALALPGLLLGCSSSSSDEQGYYQTTQQHQQKITSDTMPESAINDVVKVMANNLIKSRDYISPATPVAVASFVDLSDLESTRWLGNQLSESMVYELQHYGLKVIDFKTTGYIRVTPEGDFAQSRNWQQLPSRQIIDYVVTGSMTKQEGGVLVNSRIVGMKSNVVVATAQAFVPNWAIGEQYSKHQNVKMHDGKLIRDAMSVQSNEQKR